MFGKKENNPTNILVFGLEAGSSCGGETPHSVNSYGKKAQLRTEGQAIRRV